MKDISNKGDIEFLIKSFYDALLGDPTLNHFFLPLLKEGHLDEHIQIIVSFWHDVLFLSSDYGRNAMQPHIKLHKNNKITSDHFSSWLTHFNTTIDNHFRGEKALLAKTRAQSVATIMQIKLRDL